MRIESSLSGAKGQTLTPTLSQATEGIKGGTAVSQGEKGQKELCKACQDFEAIFTSFVLKSMRKTVMRNDLFGSAKEEEYFQDMLDARVSEAAAGQSSSGLADVLYRQLSTRRGAQAGTQAEGQSGEPTTRGNLQ